MDRSAGRTDTAFSERPPAAVAEAMRPFDLVIRNGTIVDGTGGGRYSADVGLEQDTIAAIGDLAAYPAVRIVDATGLIVAPGFIDPLHNAEMGVLLDASAEMAISQGITTGLAGGCGMSGAPVSARHRETVRRHAFFKTGYHERHWDWLGVGEYLDRLDGASAVNIATLTGFDNLWFAIRGFDMTPPTATELTSMRSLLAESMSEGAIGLSHGAGAASLWSTHAQVVEVAKGMADLGGVYACHQRTINGDDPFAWIREGISVGSESGAAVHFLHFKSTSPRTHGRERGMLEVVDQANENGAAVTLASYPYSSGGGGFRVPAWAEEGGPDETLRRLRDPAIRRKVADELNEVWTWQTRITATYSDQNARLDGRMLHEVAAEEGTTIGELICALVEHDFGSQHTHQHGGDEGLETIMVHPKHIACSDAIYTGEWPHPRCFGAYGRYLGVHVRANKVMSLEECIRQMTSSPARMMGLDDRGTLAEGMKADLVLFNEETVIDQASWAEPRLPTAGIEVVIVNGEIVRENGRFTGKTPGRALKRSGRAG